MEELDPTPRRVVCATCGNRTPSCDVINYGSIEDGYRQLCSRCFNTEIANAVGLEFQHPNFQPVMLSDCRGELHEFRFRTRLLGPRVCLDAIEHRRGEPDGYYFQIIGDPEEDLLELLGRLIEKMRRSLSVQHLQGGDSGLQIADDGVVRGQIQWDDGRDGELPLLLIDGRKIDWDQFGRMLMSYEGWQFKLTLVDKSEEL